MPARPAHPLLEHRRVRAFGEHVGVVVALEQKGFALADESREPFRNVSEVGHEADAGRVRFKSERNLGHVVRNRE